MQPVTDQIPLRIRFQEILDASVEELLDKFKQTKLQNNQEFVIKIVDQHLWLDMHKSERFLYSPHLHLELEKISNHQTNIRGLFGPQPALWTMFMFGHFVVGGIFIIAAVIAYSNWSMNVAIGNWGWVMLVMVLAWVFLYFFARMNRIAGMTQARRLYQFYHKIVTE